LITALVAVFYFLW